MVVCTADLCAGRIIFFCISGSVLDGIARLMPMYVSSSAVCQCSYVVFSSIFIYFLPSVFICLLLTFSFLLLVLACSV